MRNNEFNEDVLVSRVSIFGADKERVSIYEIAKTWAIETSIDYNKILELIYNEIKGGRFEYRFPDCYFEPIESVTIDENIDSSDILTEDIKKAALITKNQEINVVRCQDRKDLSVISSNTVISNLYSENVASFLKTIKNISEVDKKELSKYIYLSRRSFLRWAKIAWQTEYKMSHIAKPCFINEPPKFWGGLFENQPESYNSENDGTKDGYKLYEAIYFWSDPQDIRSLDGYYNKAKCTENEKLTFLPLPDKKNDYNPYVYNNKLSEVHDKFVAHFEEGRLKMWGRDSSRKKTEIEPDEVKDYLNDYKFDFRNSEIPHIGVYNLRVYKNKNVQVNNKENRWDRVISLIKDKIKYANSSKEQKFFHKKGGNGFIKGDINKKVICQSVFDEMPDELKGDIKSANVFKKQIEGFMRRNNGTLW